MKIGPDPKLFDDLARVAGGAVNMFSGLQQQIQSDIKNRIEEMAARLDLVPREDLDRAEARISKLEKDLAALNTRVDGKKSVKTASNKKTSAKAKASKKKS